MQFNCGQVDSLVIRIRVLAVVVWVIRKEEWSNHTLWGRILRGGKTSDGRRTPLHGNSCDVEVLEITTHLLEDR